MAEATHTPARARVVYLCDRGTSTRSGVAQSHVKGSVNCKSIYIVQVQQTDH